MLLLAGVLVLTGLGTALAQPYHDNDDGTVTDTRTGLIWQQTTGTVDGPNTGKVNDVNNYYTLRRSGTTHHGTAFNSFLATHNNKRVR